jgi:hypothetical protein
LFFVFLRGSWIASRSLSSGARAQQRRSYSTPADATGVSNLARRLVHGFTMLLLDDAL